ncbi:hypothetical protein CH063_14279 [Colletotrichum higginsianum]|uniref:Uncharacterized protein n=1 Tax=Colletotrichum higginsianum (strain IMI 349063) TaxID=759273 RepID=H1VXW9_COLHI|nr:hypothetical protein CH063_14279 [Colletotrichum higginsianum]
MAATVWCKDHVPTKSVIHRIHDIVNDDGLNALQLYVQSYKQADLTLTGTVRKANLMANAAAKLGGVPVTSGPRRASTTTLPTNGVAHSGNNNNNNNNNNTTTNNSSSSNTNNDETSSDHQAGEKICITCGIDVSLKWWPIENSDERELTNGHYGSLGSEAQKFVEQRKFQCHKCRKLKRKPNPHPPKDPSPKPANDRPGSKGAQSLIICLGSPGPASASACLAAHGSSSAGSSYCTTRTGRPCAPPDSATGTPSGPQSLWPSPGAKIWRLAQPSACTARLPAPETAAIPAAVRRCALRQWPCPHTPQCLQPFPTGIWGSLHTTECRLRPLCPGPGPCPTGLTVHMVHTVHTVPTGHTVLTGHTVRTVRNTSTLTGRAPMVYLLDCPMAALHKEAPMHSRKDFCLNERHTVALLLMTPEVL